MTPQKKVLFALIILGLLLPAVLALKTLRAQETEIVQLQPQATDPDQDVIIYSYTPPFDEVGEWQTGYDDAGEYEVVITASDGVQESKEKIKVVIENKNQPPRLSEEKISIKEMQKADIKKLVNDPDGDDLEFNFSSPFNENGIWITGYNDEGTYKISFTVSDKEFTEEFTVEVEVLHTNQPPAIRRSFSEEKITVLKEDDILHYFADVEDADDDSFQYRWTLNENVLSEESKGEKHFSFDEAGRHVLQLNVSDGQKETVRQWILEIKNVNRKPTLELLPMTVYEGETVILEIPETDADGQKLQYEFPKLFTADGTWNTTHDDAGKYNFTIMGSDGELQGEGTLTVTVLDVDRAPILNFPSNIWLKEGEERTWKLEAFDPDGDILNFRFNGLPENTIFNSENTTLRWTPGYDSVRSSGTLRSNLLNALGLEHRFLGPKKIPFTIVACGKELCSTSQVTWNVENTNRAPIFNGLGEQQQTNITRSATATELAHLEFSAVDPDGDKVYYSFTPPFHKQKGTWKTTYTDVGTQMVDVIASDGTQETTLPVNFTVLKNNRFPKLKLSENKVNVDELQEFTLHLSATDADNDPLALGLENLPPGASFKEGIFVWKPDIRTVLPEEKKSKNSKKEIIWLRFTVSDGEAKVTAPVKVTIQNVNQKPEIRDYLPVSEKEAVVGEPVLFHVVAKDTDNDEFKYRWDFGWGERSVQGTDTIERVFTSPGKKKVKVTVTDGKEEAVKEFYILVKEQEVKTSLQ
ncbi:PKD domain-containing protein [Candidatus Woesearchaeota archaeon]|nr:PKD domain-containing protein [Candidatus Woesearchaeota archaeon]